MGRRKEREERFSLIDELIELRKLDKLEGYLKDDKKKEDKEKKEEKKGGSWFHKVELYVLLVAFGPVVGLLVLGIDLAAIRLAKVLLNMP